MFYINLTIIFIAFVVVVSNAFNSISKTNVMKSYNNIHHMKMVSVDNSYPGQTAPFGFFDPLSLSNNIGEKRFKLWRESEIKHGRLAMLAAVGMLVAEKFNPLFGGKISGPAIYHFQEIMNVWPAFWIVILTSISVIEFYNINIGWESPQEMTSSTAMLKRDYLPGNLNFDPLNLMPRDEENLCKMMNKELNNGRLAMIGVAGDMIMIDG